MSEGPRQPHIPRSEARPAVPSVSPVVTEQSRSRFAHIPHLRRHHAAKDERDLTEVRGRLKNFNIEEDRKKADALVAKKGSLIEHPFARFNNNLDGQNPDWLPTEEAVARAKIEAERDGIKPLLPDKANLLPGENIEFAPDLTPEQQTELATPVPMVDPATGQALNTLQVNWQKFKDGDDKRVMVFLSPYNNEIENGATNYRIEELARQTGLPILAIDHPNMGGSDKLTPTQKSSLRDQKSYKAIAAAELRAMKAMGIKEIDLAGQSMGAWAAAEIAKQAAANGIVVRNVNITEAVGVKKFPLKGLMDSFRGENKYLGLYQSRQYDPKMREAGSRHKSKLTQKVNDAKFVASSLKNDFLAIYSNAMKQDGLTKTLKDALAANPQMRLINNNGTLGGVSPAEANNEMMRELAAAGYADRIKHHTYPGEPHPVMESARRFAASVNRERHNLISSIWRPNPR